MLWFDALPRDMEILFVKCVMLASALIHLPRPTLPYRTFDWEFDL
jgi:hypothetical protein